MSTNSTAGSAAPLDPTRASESRSYQVTIANLVCVIFALVLVALRVYTRLVIVRKRFWEDIAIIITMASSIIMSVCNQLGVVYGTGRHIETINKADMTNFLKISVTVSQLYSLCHFFLKLSILLQFTRVSVMPLDRRVFQGLIAINCIGYATFIVLRAVRCLPFESQWTPGMPGARCLFESTWFVFASQVWNMVMDFVILLGPLLVLRHSNAPVLQRVLIGIVLAFGAGACIISIIRIPTLLPSTITKDPMWDKVPSALYAIIEINVGIACAAVVTLRPLYRRLRDAFRGRPVSPPSVNYLNTPGRWHPSPRLGDHLDLISGETAQASSSDSCDGKMELGEAVGPPPDRGRRSGSLTSVAANCR